MSTASLQLTRLDAECKELVEVAAATLEKHFAVGRHHVACALKTKTGRIYPGIQLDCAGFDTCAEPTAIAAACLAGDDALRLIVALLKNPETGKVDVINPCGNCLQHLLVFAPRIEVLTQTAQGLRRLRLQELLPYPYSK